MRIRAKDRTTTIESLEERVTDSERRSVEALRLAKYNEQYSRKHNIRVFNYEEKTDKNLCDDFINLVKNDQITVKPEETQPIDRRLQ